MTTTKFYTCKYDRPFKELFLNPNNEDLLIALLEEILKVKINKVEIKNIETINGNIHIRKKYFDALVYTNNSKIEIEVNTEAEELVNPRNMSYICNIYQNHTLSGDTYDEDTDIIQINLTYGLEDKEKMRIYKVQDESGKEFVKNFKIIEINMDKYKKMCYSSNKISLLSILNLDKLELKDLSKKDRMVKKYMDELERVNKNPELIEYMTHEEDERKKYNTRMKLAEEKGLEKGKIEIAKNLLNKKVDISIIADTTGLSIEELNKLS